MLPGCRNVGKITSYRRVCRFYSLKQGVFQQKGQDIGERTATRLGRFSRQVKTSNSDSKPEFLKYCSTGESNTLSKAAISGTHQTVASTVNKYGSRHTGLSACLVLSEQQSFHLLGKTRAGDTFTNKHWSKNMANDEVSTKSPIQANQPVVNLSSHKIFRELLTKELLTVVHAFTKKGHEVRIVGGAVRDILLSRHLPKDIDLATTATPDEMVDTFKASEIRYIETGLDHGTLTAHLNGHNYEITTLRIDTEHDGRRAVVEFTNDWRLDAERRDLTINAMSIDFDGNLYDYFGGVDDLQAKHVRFVGDPEKRIKEDYLRILRYFRFYGRISETADDHVKSTLEVIRKCSAGLKNVAVERVWTELSRILIANFAPSLLKLMYELGVAENIGLPPRTKNHLEMFEYVWNHGHAHKLEPVTILMSLVDSVEEAEDLARSLKLSSAERNLGKFIVTHRAIHDNQDVKKPYKDIIASCNNAKVIDILHQHVSQLLLYQGKEDLADELGNWQPPSFPVSGNDLKHVGVKPGPSLGKLLHELKLLWMESYYTLGKDELLEKVEHLKETIH